MIALTCLPLIPTIHEINSRVMLYSSKVETLLDGEFALEDAPHATLKDGSVCIPQHYLSYQHSLRSVEALVLKMKYSDLYPIFVSQENNDIYIQIGIIGYDNYQSKEAQSNAKIVYGRKWRVEPNLPTSEIIQTVFLAIKKAREHEIRELMRITIHDVTSTPFNNHHDAPLITKSVDQGFSRYESTEEAENAFRSLLSNICYDGIEFELNVLEKRHSDQWLVELSSNVPDSSMLREFDGLKRVSYSIELLSINHFLRGLMATLIQLSDRHVDENFLFDGVPRFSWNLDIIEIAALSGKTRSLHVDEDKQAFCQNWQRMNYQTDATRVPFLADSPLGRRIKRTINEFGPLDGVLPNFSDATYSDCPQQ